MIWRYRNPFSQWQHSFQRKLRFHWLKFLRQRHVAVARQSPVTWYIVIHLSHHWFSCPTSSNHLKQWLNVTETINNKPRGNLNQNTHITKKLTFKMSSAKCRSFCSLIIGLYNNKYRHINIPPVNKPKPVQSQLSGNVTWINYYEVCTFPKNISRGPFYQPIIKHKIRMGVDNHFICLTTTLWGDVSWPLRTRDK